jgi:NADPH:quinone reductase
MLGARGCLVNYGELSGELPRVDLTDLMERALFVTKFGGGSAYFDTFAELLGLVADGLELASKRPEVVSAAAGRFPLEQAAAAYRGLDSRPAGKILVVP